MNSMITLIFNKVILNKRLQKLSKPFTIHLNAFIKDMLYHLATIAVILHLK